MKKPGRIILLCLLSCFTVSNVYAGGGVTGGATEVTQLMNNAELVKEVSQLAEQIQNQITMLQDMSYNTVTIPDQLFRDVRFIYSGVKGVIDRTNGLAYNLANLDEELKRRFKSYGDMASLSRVADFSSEYRNIADSQMETVRNTMEAIGVSFEELSGNDAATLAALQNKAGSAKGRNELIQATNQLLAFMTDNTMKLRQTQMLQAQMAGTAYEAERAGGDLANRRIDSFFKRGDESSTEIPSGSIIERFGR